MALRSCSGKQLSRDHQRAFTDSVVGTQVLHLGTGVLVLVITQVPLPCSLGTRHTLGLQCASSVELVTAVWLLVVVWCSVVVVWCSVVVVWCSVVVVWCSVVIAFCCRRLVFCCRRLVFCCRRLVFCCRRLVFCCRRLVFCRRRLMGDQMLHW